MITANDCSPRRRRRAKRARGRWPYIKCVRYRCFKHVWTGAGTFLLIISVWVCGRVYMWVFAFEWECFYLWEWVFMCIWIAYQPCTHFFIFQSIFKCILFGSYIPVLLASFFPPLLLLLHHHVPSAPLPQTRPSKAQITSSKEGHITSGHQLQTSRVRQRGQRWERGGYVWCMRGGDLCVVSGIGWYDGMVWCGIG